MLRQIKGLPTRLVLQPPYGIFCLEGAFRMKTGPM